MKLVERSRTAAFVIIAFAFSYGAGLGSQWVVAVQGWAGVHPLVDGLPGFLVVLGPALAAVLVTRWSGESVAGWLAADWRATRLAWWWVAIPPLTLAVTMVSFDFAGVPLRDPLSDLPALADWYLFHVFLVALPEEIGWRGWLLREQLSRRAPWRATLFVALIWGLWHFPKLVGSVPFAAAFVAAVAVNSVLLTVLWSRFNGRTALAALAHGSFNAPIYFFSDQADPLDAVRGFAVTVGAYALVAAAIVLLTRTWWTTGERHLRPAPPSAKARGQ